MGSEDKRPKCTGKRPQKKGQKLAPKSAAKLGGRTVTFATLAPKSGPEIGIIFRPASRAHFSVLAGACRGADARGVGMPNSWASGNELSKKREKQRKKFGQKWFFRSTFWARFLVLVSAPLKHLVNKTWTVFWPRFRARKNQKSGRRFRRRPSRRQCCQCGQGCCRGKHCCSHSYCCRRPPLRLIF